MLHQFFGAFLYSPISNIYIFFHMVHHSGAWSSRKKIEIEIFKLKYLLL